MVIAAIWSGAVNTHTLSTTAMDLPQLLDLSARVMRDMERGDERAKRAVEALRGAKTVRHDDGVVCPGKWLTLAPSTIFSPAEEVVCEYCRRLLGAWSKRK